MSTLQIENGIVDLLEKVDLGWHYLLTCQACLGSL
jgi:hypothetical protein